MAKFRILTPAKALLFVFALLLFPKQGKADEGMWLPMHVKNYIEVMRQKGCLLSAEDIYSLNKASLKDAIVHFGGFCTGELVSSQGLVFTNHHCGYDAIASLSSPEHNYLDSGYWAPSFEKELPAEGLFVTFLVRMEDVTDRVRYAKDKDEAIKRIVQEVESDGKYTARVTPILYEHQYILWVYQTFEDVRFVGTPPASIGKFGGDTDNWMWPRHTGDFSVFRVYADANNAPAAYSPDNKPYQPKHFLPISLAGISPGDFTMIMGFPARTTRYLPLPAMEYKVREQYPSLKSMFAVMLRIMERDMAADIRVKLALASTQARFANSEKYYQGVMEAMRDAGIWEQRQAFESGLEAWAASQEGDMKTVVKDFRALYESAQSSMLQGLAIRLVQSLNPVLARGKALYSLYRKLSEGKDEEAQAMAEKLQKGMARSFEDDQPATYRKVLGAMLKQYKLSVPAERIPGWMGSKEVAKLKSPAGGDRYQAMANYIYDESVLASKEKLVRFLSKPSAKDLEKDPGFLLAKDFVKLETEIEAATAYFNSREKALLHLWMEAWMKYQPNRNFYPDANSTLRLTYGTVEAYDPRDAVEYSATTSHEGLLEKEIPGDHEFDLPARLKSLLKKRDFGPYANGSGDLQVNFLSNNDITGGNSGSPVINAKGQLVGIAFDGNWESMAGDIVFDPRYKRTISVDIRYVLFVMDKLGGAQRLLDELTIVKN